MCTVDVIDHFQPDDYNVDDCRDPQQNYGKAGSCKYKYNSVSRICLAV